MREHSDDMVSSMDSGWAVVVGAFIGLLGSMAGAVLTPVLVARVERSRDRKSVAREDARERLAALGDAITEVLTALLDQFTGVTGATPGEVVHLLKRSMLAMLALGLLLSDDDQPIASIVASAHLLVLEDAPIAMNCLTALTSALPAWRRGVLSGWEALDSYRLQSGDPVVIEGEARYRSSL
jgi:hypothetical protein